MSLASHLHSHPKNEENFNKLHSKKSVQIIDKLAMIVGVLAPLTALPQIYQLIITKDATGVSILAWVLYIITASFWIIYGVAHKERAIIINNALWAILEFIIVLLALIY
ncbi:MAG: MtN3 and saliva related transmembrane protein [candidate division CPR2 bacterium GW2011_GWC1_39_9]|uniref:MtN3 and saliva related transmembrane protein n=1 Tax=candidate division CPR2 bacterium GW2011_GWC2_39_10 TaxID=1618345 RepID=A0A0G0LSC0_UNCC2|nr:MAG: MtN3 and saliva related transmembrane protein [candidate division CPR2 bacterium GW2011_GWC2_39_10]KKR34568.1 MAG: MtN3 and saliva related transmembrane protein [candidate division CPR2 bacterium GW2011_GWC1_39_9]